MTEMNSSMSRPSIENISTRTYTVAEEATIAIIQDTSDGNRDTLVANGSTG